MADHHVFDDGQPQTGAAGLGDAAVVRSIKTFGQPGDMGRVDTDAVVGDGQVCAVGILPPADVDGAFGRSVFHRVGNQVAEGAFQFGRVGDEPGVQGDIQFNSVVFVAADGQRIVFHAVKHAVYRYGLPHAVGFGAFQSGQQQQVGDQGFHAVGLVVHLHQRPAQACLLIGDGIEQGFQVALEHGERGFQLMADVGDEVFAHLLQVVQAGHVTGDQELFADTKLGDAELEDAVVVHRRGNFQRFVKLALGQVLGEAGVANQVGKRLPQILAGIEPHGAFRSMVPVFQVTVLVDQDDHVVQGIHRLLGTMNNALQVFLGAAFLLE